MPGVPVPGSRLLNGLLSLLPEEKGRAYGSGYGGGDPSELARYITRLLDSGGEDTAAGGNRRHDDRPDPGWSAGHLGLRGLDPLGSGARSGWARMISLGRWRGLAPGQGRSVGGVHGSGCGPGATKRLSGVAQ